MTTERSWRDVATAQRCLEPQKLKGTGGSFPRAAVALPTP